MMCPVANAPLILIQKEWKFVLNNNIQKHHLFTKTQFYCQMYLNEYEKHFITL